MESPRHDHHGHHGHRHGHGHDHGHGHNRNRDGVFHNFCRNLADTVNHERIGVPASDSIAELCPFYFNDYLWTEGDDWTANRRRHCGSSAPVTFGTDSDSVTPSDCHDTCHNLATTACGSHVHRDKHGGHCYCGCMAHCMQGLALKNFSPGLYRTGGTVESARHIGQVYGCQPQSWQPWPSHEPHVGVPPHSSQ